MRRMLLACTLLAACKISDAHFVGGGLPDGGGDAMIDASLTPLKHAYIVDETAGILLLTKDPATGALAGISSLSTQAPTPYHGAVVSKSGTRLFLFSGDTAASSMVTTLAIGSDGKTTDAGSLSLSMCPAPKYPRLDPTGKYILVSCIGGVLLEIKISPDGTLAIGSNLPFGGNTQLDFTLSGTGTCGFALDTSIAPSKVISFSLDPMSGALGGGPSMGLQLVPSDLAASIDGTYLYIAGTANNGPIAEYDIDASCNLTPKTMTASTQSAPTAIAVDPTGKYVFATGNQPYSYIIGANGILGSNGTGNGSYTAQVMDLVFDPQFPTMSYAVLAPYVIAGPVNAAGVLQGGVVYPGNGQKTAAFVLAP